MLLMVLSASRLRGDIATRHDGGKTLSFFRVPFTTLSQVVFSMTAELAKFATGATVYS